MDAGLRLRLRHRCKTTLDCTRLRRSERKVAGHAVREFSCLRVVSFPLDEKIKGRCQALNRVMS